MSFPTDCEFLLRTRLKGPEFKESGGLGPLVENCSLTGKMCYLADAMLNPVQCTRRTWALDYIAKQDWGKTAPRGPE